MKMRLTRTETQKLIQLLTDAIEDDHPNIKISIKQSFGSGIGINTTVKINGEKYDLTDYSCW